MTLRKIERDSMGVPVDDTPSPALRQIRQEEGERAGAHRHDCETDASQN